MTKYRNEKFRKLMKIWLMLDDGSIEENKEREAHDRQGSYRK